MQDQALAGIKVLDVSHHIAGPYCTKLLADFGAQVIKVERPDGGDPTRKTGPFRDDKPDPESSVLFFSLNNNKQGITLDLKTDAGLNTFKEMVKKVDILVENFSPRVMSSLGLGYDNLKALNPGLVMTSISNFGQSGPYRDYKATDIVLQALGGWLSPRGETTREPLRAAGKLRVSEMIGGMYAALATMTAFSHKVQTGMGQHVDVSLMEAVACVIPHVVEQNMFPDNRPWIKARFRFTPGVEECKDGYIGVNVLSGQHWISMCQMMGMEDWSENPDYNTMQSRFFRSEEVQNRMRPWLMERTKEEIMTEGQDWRVPVSPVYSTRDMLESPQHQARDYFVEIKHPILGSVTQPGAIFQMTETPWRLKCPAPCLGEHNEEVRNQLLGQGNEESGEVRQSGATGGSKTAPVSKLPLEGLRVLDLSYFWSGPYSTAYLGAMGAEVIKVESIQRPDTYRFGNMVSDFWWEKFASWNCTNINKYGLTLDLTQPRGMELFKDLVKVSDIVVENFAPRVMEQFGLTYPVLREIKSDIIMMSMPAFGLTGPWRDYVGFGLSLEQVSGLTYLTGYTDSAPVSLFGAADPIVGTHAAFAILAALEYRRRTGKGQFIEISQAEVLTNFMGPALADYSINKRVWQREGNRDPNMAPHGVYRCKGEDLWIAIAVSSDQEWKAFCQAIGKPELAKHESFSTMASRLKNQDSLNILIEQWTSKYDYYEVMDILQKAGIAAGAVIITDEVHHEPQIAARGLYHEMTRDIVGTQIYPRWPMIFSALSPVMRPAPTLGQHNDYVLTSILGLSEAEMEDLEKNQVIGNIPLGAGHVL